MIYYPPILEKSVELANALYPSAFQELRTFHVSVLWNKNKLLSVGVNKKATHTRNLFNKKLNREGIDISSTKFQCSELCAFIGLGKQRYNIDFSRVTMVNIRLDYDGNISLASPCISCRSLILYLGLKKVYYTDNNKEFQIYKC